MAKYYICKDCKRDYVFHPGRCHVCGCKEFEEVNSL